MLTVDSRHPQIPLPMEATLLPKDSRGQKVHVELWSSQPQESPASRDSASVLPLTLEPR